MSLHKKTIKIPPSLYQYFWDVDVKRLDPQEKPYFVINRLLDKGNLIAVRWVVRNFPTKTIQETFKRMRDFRAKIGYFWGLYLHIPKENIVCLQEPYLKMRSMHWPY